MKVLHEESIPGEPTRKIQVGQATWGDEISVRKYETSRNGRFSHRSSPEVPAALLLPMMAALEHYLEGEREQL